MEEGMLGEGWIGVGGGVVSGLVTRLLNFPHR